MSQLKAHLQTSEWETCIPQRLTKIANLVYVEPFIIAMSDQPAANRLHLGDKLEKFEILTTIKTVA